MISVSHGVCHPYINAQVLARIGICCCSSFKVPRMEWTAKVTTKRVLSPCGLDGASIDAHNCTDLESRQQARHMVVHLVWPFIGKRNPRGING
jgi:hypothetical protein